MHAICVQNGALTWQQVPEPRPRADEALVRVRAAGVNRADLLQAAGRYPAPPGASEILGLEVAGEILEAPAGSGFASGDRVCALLSGGGYAERVAVPTGQLLPVPDRLAFEAAAAVPEAHLTATLNLFLEGRLAADERVLITAGASGVGTAAIQQARLAGARVATTSSVGKLDACRSLGADPALDRRDPDWPERLAEAFGEVDVILDAVGADMAEPAQRLLALDGRWVWIGALSGDRIELRLGPVLRKRLRCLGSTLRGRSKEAKRELVAWFCERFYPDLKSGRLAPVLDRVVDVREAQAAHDAMRANETVGKVVLRIP